MNRWSNWDIWAYGLVTGAFIGSWLATWFTSKELARAPETTIWTKLLAALLAGSITSAAIATIWALGDHFTQ